MACLLNYAVVPMRTEQGRGQKHISAFCFFNRFGEMRHRSFENQCYRASGLNLVIFAIVLWNTVYLERVIQYLKDNGQTVNQVIMFGDRAKW